MVNFSSRKVDFGSCNNSFHNLTTRSDILEMPYPLVFPECWVQYIYPVQFSKELFPTLYRQGYAKN